MPPGLSADGGTCSAGGSEGPGEQSGQHGSRSEVVGLCGRDLVEAVLRCARREGPGHLRGASAGVHPPPPNACVTGRVDLHLATVQARNPDYLK